MRLELVDMEFGYGETPVLHNINLALEEPGLISIIGPNGVGKSTLVKCMNRILKAKGGKIFLDGQDIQEIDLKEIAKKIGFVPSHSSDVFAMTVIDTVLLGRHNHQKWKTSTNDLEIVHRALDMLGLEPYAMRPANQLSAGQYQKVALARGIVQQTPMLILDEPTSNLDVNHQIYVTELLRAYSHEENSIVLMICHDLNIAARYSHKVIVMKEPGIIYRIGTPREVITKDVISAVYNVECEVIDVDGSPHVILKNCLDDGEFDDIPNES